MTADQQTDNQRVRLSKRLLQEALLRLLQKGELESISVQKLCQEAQINRSTFYRYYGSTRDVLDEMKADFFQKMETGILVGEYDSLLSLEKTLTCLLDNRELVSALQRTYSESSMIEELLKKQPVMEQLQRNARSGFSDEDAGYAMDFAVYGSWAVIRRWLFTGDREALPHIAALLLEINRQYQQPGRLP